MGSRMYILCQEPKNEHVGHNTTPMARVSKRGIELGVILVPRGSCMALRGQVAPCWYSANSNRASLEPT